MKTKHKHESTSLPIFTCPASQVVVPAGYAGFTAITTSGAGGSLVILYKDWRDKPTMGILKPQHLRKFRKNEWQWMRFFKSRMNEAEGAYVATNFALYVAEFPEQKARVRFRQAISEVMKEYGAVHVQGIFDPDVGLICTVQPPDVDAGRLQ